ncbi:MAG: hypothetical protein O3B47_04875, partial [bacterium]|nr:hypothetical protein [bacterium]
PSPGNLIPVRVRASDGSALQNCLGLTPLTFFIIIINSLHLELETPYNKSVAETTIAGNSKSTEALAPAPDSWAAAPENEVNIWIIRMDAGAEWTLPKALGFAEAWLNFLPRRNHEN